MDATVEQFVAKLNRYTTGEASKGDRSGTIRSTQWAIQDDFIYRFLDLGLDVVRASTISIHVFFFLLRRFLVTPPPTVRKPSQCTNRHQIHKARLYRRCARSQIDNEKAHLLDAPR